MSNVIELFGPSAGSIRSIDQLPSQIEKRTSFTNNLQQYSISYHVAECGIIKCEKRHLRSQVVM